VRNTARMQGVIFVQLHHRRGHPGGRWLGTGLGPSALRPLVPTFPCR
jgi:hypothetical protein